MNFSFKAQDTITSFGAQCLLAIDSAKLAFRTLDVNYKAKMFGRDILYRVTDGAFSTGKAFYYGSTKAYKIVRNNETIKYYVKNPSEIPGAIRSTASYFWKNPGQLLIAGISFKATTLGFLAGYLTPDLDIAILGIGGHRNWAFHSAIPVWLIKKMSCLLNKVDCSDDSKRSKAINVLQKYIGAPLVAGYSFGVGTHLVIDSLSIKDVVGFPMEYLLSGGNVLDRVWLFGNGLICFSIGKELILFALGKEDDIEKIKLLAEKAGSKGAH